MLFISKKSEELTNQVKDLFIFKEILSVLHHRYGPMCKLQIVTIDNKCRGIKSEVGIRLRLGHIVSDHFPSGAPSFFDTLPSLDSLDDMLTQYVLSHNDVAHRASLDKEIIDFYVERFSNA